MLQAQNELCNKPLLREEIISLESTLTELEITQRYLHTLLEVTQLDEHLSKNDLERLRAEFDYMPIKKSASINIT